MRHVYHADTMPTTLVESDLPLSIHLTSDGDPTRDCVLYNGRKLGLLQYYHVAYDEHGLRSKFGCIGVFPPLLDAPEDANSNSAYPLRFRLSNYRITETGIEPPEEMITFHGRPLGLLKAFYIHLRADEKREVRLIFHQQVNQELLDALEALTHVVVCVHPSEVADACL